MKLDPIKEIKIEHRVEIEKKQEFKLIGRTVRRKGQFLFAFNDTTNEVYKVPVQKINIVDFDNKNASTHKAVINPEHKMILAINLKNAQRKFKKLLKV